MSSIQIFALKRDFNVQKAERFFKERRVAYQFVDLSRRGMSLRELESVCRAVGLENMVRLSDKDWESHYVAQLRDTKEALEKLSQHPGCSICPSSAAARRPRSAMRPRRG